MLIIPAIDLLDGQVVRLRQGRYDDVTVYPKSAEDYAALWRDAGAERIHVVDLAGARSGQFQEWILAERIIKTVKISVELGGGIRRTEDIARAISLGARYVVLGTAALDDKPLLRAALDLYGDRIVIGLDCRGRKLATKGWHTQSDVELIPFAQHLEKQGVRQVIYTNIERDGMMSGPDISGLRELLAGTNLSVVLSGGVSRAEDLTALSCLTEPRFAGVICGRALYDGRIRLKEVIESARRVK